MGKVELKILRSEHSTKRWPASHRGMAVATDAFANDVARTSCAILS